MKHILIRSLIILTCVFMVLASILVMTFLHAIPIRIHRFPLSMAPAGEVLLNQKTTFIRTRDTSPPLLSVILKNRLWQKHQTVLTKKGQEIWLEIEEWKKERDPVVLFPKNELKNQITQAGLFAIPFLIEKEYISLELWVDVRKLMFQAPKENFGTFEKFLMPFFYILNVQSLDTLKNTLPKINNVSELMTYAAFLQQGEPWQNFLEASLTLIEPRHTDILFNYLGRFKEEGIAHLKSLLENQSLGTLEFYLKNQFLTSPDSMPFLNIFNYVEHVPPGWFHQHAKKIAYIRFLFMMACVYCLILSLTSPFIRWTFGRGVMQLLAAALISLGIFLASETHFLTSTHLPVFQIESSILPPVPFSFDLTKEQGDLKMIAYSIAMMLFFLFIQGLLFILSLFQISKIRHAPHPPSLKLELLHNEEPFFDAGLYVGLSGTVFSLILLSFGLSELGLSSAYTSTLFGIIQVAILKLLFVRPLRKNLLMSQSHVLSEVKESDSL